MLEEMEWWQIALLSFALAALTFGGIGYFFWRKASAKARRLSDRVQALSWEERFAVA
jgi:hypothetical protein